MPGSPYDRHDVYLHLGDARSFVARNDEKYDLIQLPLLNSFGAVASGVYSLHESYISTVQALEAYWRALEPGGVVAITRWLKLPPRDSLKLFATAIEALEYLNISKPPRHLALIRSWRTTTLLVKKEAFTTPEIVAVRRFTADRSFDLAYYPGISADEANRYNLLDKDYFYEGATALIGPKRQHYLERYKFAIVPATDDQPYFFDFFKWRSLPELLALRSQGTASMLDWGYLILFATLIQAIFLSLIFILLPLWFRRRRLGSGAPRVRIGFYFLALGIAFLFIEIAYIQRFILFLGHPLYAIAVVLAGFLVFAGLGSAASRRLASWHETSPVGDQSSWTQSACAFLGRASLGLSIACISAIGLLYLVLLPPLFSWVTALPDAAKVVISLLLLAPLAFFMGMPFPLGLIRVADRAPDLVPWAWGINGCASVLARYSRHHPRNPSRLHPRCGGCRNPLCGSCTGL
jgi:hypothetical protein